MKELEKYFNKTEQTIYDKVVNGKRVNASEGLYLYENCDIDFCGYLANIIKEKKHSKNVFFNKNIHIELSNICENNCDFCSFSRNKDSPDSWNMDVNDALEYLRNHNPENLTEVHITGAILKEKNLKFYSELFTKISQKYPHLHIKALTAVEVEYIAKIDKISPKEVLGKLIESGLNSLAGGGAEIFDNEIRKIICDGKTTSKKWLEIHEIAHSFGISSNCTMLFGHIENYEHRINHMEELRKLQDITKGFNCFIPLKYKHQNNKLKVTKEVSLNEELKNYAISRIYLDNIPHIKAYWPMCGKETAFLSLHFGVDDIDGTINESTKIYSMAGSSEKKPRMNEVELQERIKKMGFSLVERDSNYMPM